MEFRSSFAEETSGGFRILFCERGLFLNEHGFVLLEIFLYDLDSGKGSPGPFGLIFEELIMHQPLADFFHMEIGILHFPDLACL
jgi:hypothetical protein